MREIVIHVDDVAGSHGANVAFVKLTDSNAVTSGSVMVPCPWFPEIAAIARTRPDFDLGVHLVLNAEWPGFRWRPLTGVSTNGLTDDDGFFCRDVASARNADPAAVEAELRAQIDTALDAGIDATHLDSHMGTVMMPEFLDIYLRLGADYRLPVVLPRSIVEWAGTRGHEARYEAAMDALAARGNPDFSRYLTSPFHDTAGQTTEEVYHGIFRMADDALNWGAFHMTVAGEFAAISPDAPMRAAEYDLFASGQAALMMKAAGLTPVGMRGFRDAMRAQ
jgi:predicted glycoside hydrolase/deacetylase ChbG (UPF0249 family)